MLTLEESYEETISLTEPRPEQQWPEIPPLIRSGQHYEHAPIAEAIIDVRCDLPEEVSLDDLLLSVDAEDFAATEQVIAVQGRLDVSEEGIHGETVGRSYGHVFRRKDSSRVVQARLDGFSYTWMPPYDRWETFVAEAEAHWLHFRQVAKPTSATRLGVRFVNKIDIPSSQVEIKDYLRINIDVPAYLPQAVSSYFLQVEVALPDFGCAATITSTLVTPPNAASTSLVLDIDTWHEGHIDLVMQPQAEDVANGLEILRNAKNYVFESCITDATRGLIS